MDNNAPVPAERMAFTLREFQKMMGISRSTVCRAIASGELRTVKIRGRRLVPRLEVARITGATAATIGAGTAAADSGIAAGLGTALSDAAMIAPVLGVPA